MVPTIEVDSIILVHEEDSTNLDVGTVITFDFKNKYNNLDIMNKFLEKQKLPKLTPGETGNLNGLF